MKRLKSKSISLVLVIAMLIAIAPGASLPCYGTTIKGSIRWNYVYERINSIDLAFEYSSNSINDYYIYKVTKNIKGKYIYKKIKTIWNQSSCKYTVKGLKSNTKYMFAVKGFKKSGGKYKYTKMSVVKSATTKPEVKIPKKITFNTAYRTATSIKLKWKKSSNARGYYIYQVKTKNGEAYKSKIATTTGLAYTVKNLDVDTSYVFYVRAYNRNSSSRKQDIVYKYSPYAKYVAHTAKYYGDEGFRVEGQIFEYNFSAQDEESRRLEFRNKVIEEFDSICSVNGQPKESLTFSEVYDPDNCITLENNGRMTFNRPGVAKVRVTASKTHTSEECEIIVYRVTWKGNKNFFLVPSTQVNLSDREIHLKDYINVEPESFRAKVLADMKFEVSVASFDDAHMGNGDTLVLDNGGGTVSIDAKGQYTPENTLSIDNDECSYFAIDINADCVLPVDEQYIREHNSSDAYVMYEGEDGDRRVKIQRGASWDNIKEQVGTVDAVYPRPDCNLYVYDINYGLINGEMVQCNGDFDHFLGVYVYKETNTIAGWITNQKQLAVINGKEIVRGETKLCDIQYLFSGNNSESYYPFNEGNIRYNSCNSISSNQYAYDRASLSLMFAITDLDTRNRNQETIAFAEIVPQSFLEWTSQALGGKETFDSDGVYCENQINMCRKTYSMLDGTYRSILKHDESLANEQYDENSRVVEYLASDYDIMELANWQGYIKGLCVQTSETNIFSETNSIFVTDHVKIGRNKIE